eukprot:gene16990-20219_t
MVATGAVGKGVIIGLDGNTLACTAGFSMKAGEGSALINLFKNPANCFASGITVGGVKYMGIKGDPLSVYGKNGPTGLYGATQQPGNAVVYIGQQRKAVSQWVVSITFTNADAR